MRTQAVAATARKACRMSESPDPDATRQRLLIGLESLLSVVGVVMVFVFPAYLWGAYFCLGVGCTGPGEEEARAYRLLVAVLVVLVLATLAVAARRGARLALAWHVLVALLGIASAIVFQVPAVDWVDHFREEPPPVDRHYVPCHSGSNDCPGG